LTDTDNKDCLKNDSFVMSLFEHILHLARTEVYNPSYFVDFEWKKKIV